MKTITMAVAGGMLALAAAGAAAQTMYRCGKVFQDRPCEAGVQEQRITPGGAHPAPSGGAAGSGSSPFAFECGRRGEHAQRIMWQREGGATMERQINDAHGNREMVDLVQNVYARRGTAPEVRAAVEGDCVAEKQRAADAAAALANLQQQAGKPATGAATVATPGNAPPAQVQPTAVVAGPSPMCASWRARREAAESNLRRGGSASTMERWQQERRDVERLMSDGRC